MSEQTVLERAQEQLRSMMETYAQLSEREKFALGGEFTKTTGGKLSPFDSPDVVCVALVPVRNNNGELGFVGVRRAIPPCVGEVALPGGFLNKQEDPSVGAMREVLEETGLIVENAHLKTVGAKMGHNNHTLVFFESTVELSEADLKSANQNLAANTDGEASELVFVSPSVPLCFPLHQEAVNNSFLSHNVQPEISLGASTEFKPK